MSRNSSSLGSSNLRQTDAMDEEEEEEEEDCQEAADSIRTSSGLTSSSSDRVASNKIVLSFQQIIANIADLLAADITFSWAKSKAQFLQKLRLFIDRPGGNCVKFDVFDSYVALYAMHYKWSKGTGASLIEALHLPHLLEALNNEQQTTEEEEEDEEEEEELFEEIQRATRSTKIRKKGKSIPSAKNLAAPPVLSPEDITLRQLKDRFRSVRSQWLGFIRTIWLKCAPHDKDDCRSVLSVEATRQGVGFDWEADYDVVCSTIAEGITKSCWKGKDIVTKDVPGVGLRHFHFPSVQDVEAALKQFHIDKVKGHKRYVKKKTVIEAALKNGNAKINTTANYLTKARCRRNPPLRLKTTLPQPIPIALNNGLLFGHNYENTQPAEYNQCTQSVGESVWLTVGDAICYRNKMNYDKIDDGVVKSFEYQQNSDCWTITTMDYVTIDADMWVVKQADMEVHEMRQAKDFMWRGKTGHK